MEFFFFVKMKVLFKILLMLKITTSNPIFSQRICAYNGLRQIGYSNFRRQFGGKPTNYSETYPQRAKLSKATRSGLKTELPSRLRTFLRSHFWMDPLFHEVGAQKHYWEDVRLPKDTCCNKLGRALNFPTPTNYTNITVTKK